jgi:hypothetical protein
MADVQRRHLRNVKQGGDPTGRMMANEALSSLTGLPAAHASE